MNFRKAQLSLVFIIALLFHFKAFAGQSGKQFIDAANSAIRYVGRIDFSDKENPRFDWGGVYIQFQFTGKSCAVKMSDTRHDYFQVMVDNLPAKVMKVTGDTILVIADNLKNKLHKVEIVKRTEGEQGTATFSGIYLDEGAVISPWPNAPKHKIQFIGNSITCGYGVEGKSKNAHFKPETENSYKSYAPITARAFDADYHLVSHSGYGVVRNYGYKGKISPEPMPSKCDQVYDMKEQPKWNFSNWIPDAVVINLGTNDFSTHPFPDKAVFQRGYENLILRVQKNYPGVPVFCIVGPMIDEPCYSYVKEMVEAFRQVHQVNNVYFVGVPTYLMIPGHDLGADSHPNYSGQKKTAAFLVPVMSSVLGWKYNGDEFLNK
ncbi:SGNH/GDSL hydrolase family protein [Prolixibacter denitrificans]|uniref:Endoglucanase n=1 Tax=Prolixibacter denitrificans TaxID=1541063 RepID=A0A2P8C8K4_9BACT|nr:SGNH/GDSL hydrolase family protein [Prolixibacter denitrificans]PSK81290.1 lysophospholipase L1-like esterase [Prolixibacter denitrificans]GET21625.1 endoglucanase [Prolixibacter denitrificans]